MKVALVSAICFFMIFQGKAGAGEWEGPRELPRQLTCVCAAEQAGALFCGTTDGEVGVSFDNGENWDFRRCAAGWAAQVDSICYDPGSSQVYAGLRNRIYRSADNGKSWSLASRLDNAAACHALVATSQGLFCSNGAAILHSGNGRTWRVKERMAQVTALAYSPFGDSLFAANASGIRCLDLSSGLWRNLAFASPSVEEEGAESQKSSEGAGNVSSSAGIRALAVGEKGELFAATVRALYRRDGAGSWVSRSLPAHPAGGLAWSRGTLYVIAAGGIFSCGGPTKGDGERAGSPEGLFPGDEPDIASVRRAAVAYADACPEAIARWRSLARRKAWLPHLTVGIDRETGDLWHWESGSTTRTDDDCLRKGKDSVNWSVSLIWELSDLVWNDAQTSIDARSRLKAEQRQEIIDEVTRLYFERARLRLEIESLPLEQSQKRREKALKIEEDAALLDGLTDGFFLSRRRLNGAKSTCK